METNKDLGVPEDILECAKVVSLNLLPQKSREIYEYAYQRFIDWCKGKNVQVYSEDVVIVYFSNFRLAVYALVTIFPVAVNVGYKEGYRYE
ncbi:hypothetical protein QE152_g24905 [Popillia japonica]|uniref:Uncharacterized protein n=1 Tax=Popillia japonica TaxID=7064 RepID=A0AAW1K254_POPJA